jgi:hypothetical protein
MENSEPLKPLKPSPEIAHLFVYGRVRKNSRNVFVDRKKILEILRWYIRIPGPHQLQFFNSMVDGIKCSECGHILMPSLFKKVSRDRYEVLKPRSLITPKDFYGSPLWPR